jgi:peptide/nickel transport system permease protein
MTAYVVRRIGASVVTILAIVTLAFLVTHLVLRDPARTILGNYATPKLVAELNHAWGLDKPLWDQYGIFMGQLVHGDLGRSFRTNRPVALDLREQ